MATIHTKPSNLYALQGGDFWKWRFIRYIQVDGWKWRFSHMMTSFLGFRHAFLHKQLENAVRKHSDYFRYGGKSFQFWKYLATCGQSNTIWKCYVWMEIFKYGEKSPLLKIAYLGKKVIAKWQKAYNSGDKNTWLFYRNKVKSTIAFAKQNFYSDKIKQNLRNGDCHKWWS